MILRLCDAGRATQPNQFLVPTLEEKEKVDMKILKGQLQGHTAMLAAHQERGKHHS